MTALLILGAILGTLGGYYLGWPFVAGIALCVGLDLLKALIA
jgi:hypothetical protein